MSVRSGWYGARAQVAWILALVLSTAAIVYLERFDLNPASSRLDAANPFGTASADIAKEATAALAAAEAAYSAEPDDTPTGALLLVALSVAANAGVTDAEDAAARAAALIDVLDTQNPLVRSGRALAALSFGLLLPPITAPQS